MKIIRTVTGFPEKEIQATRPVERRMTPTRSPRIEVLRETPARGKIMRALEATRRTKILATLRKHTTASAGLARASVIGV